MLRSGPDDAGRGRGWRPAWSAAVVALALILAHVAPALPVVAGACASRPAPSSLLGWFWCLLETQSGPLQSLSALLAAAGVWVAVRTLLVTQRLNRATAIFTAMKEGRDLRARWVVPTGMTDAQRAAERLALGISLFASIHPFREAQVIDDGSWQVFERDLAAPLRRGALDDWLAGRPFPPLPPCELFAPAFVAYLRKLRAEPRAEERP